MRLYLNGHNWTTNTVHFPLSWTNDSKFITHFDFSSLTLGEQKVVQELTNFKFTYSHTQINLDIGDVNKIEKYLGELV